MATPPTSSPPGAGKKTVAARVRPAVDPSAPFVIEAGGLSAFVEQSDAILPSAGKRVAKATAKVSRSKASVKTAPVVPAAEAVVPAAIHSVTDVPVPAFAPVVDVIEDEAPAPSQQVVADPLIAAIETIAPIQSPNALEGHHIMNEAIETTKKFAEDTKARFQTVIVELNEKTKAAVEKSSRTFEELGDITKGNLEAIVESSKIAAKGVESLGQSAAEYGRASFEKSSATFKSFASVKSPTEFFALQSELFTSAFDTLASESAKTSETVLKLASDIAQPISSRVALVSDKFKSFAA